jgi:leucyl aminopeptidase
MTVTAQRFQADKLSADATVVFLSQDEAALREQSAFVRETWEAALPVFESKDFAGSRDSSVVVYTGAKKSPRLILVGLGEGARINLERIRRAAALGAQRAVGVKATSIAMVVPQLDTIDPAAVAQAIVEGASLGTYSYDKYFVENRDTKVRKRLDKLSLVVRDDAALKEVKRGAAIGQGVVNGVTLCRDLVNAPSNEIYPEALAAAAKRELTPLGVTVRVLNKQQIEKLKMGGVLAVNQGSQRPPFFIVMEYYGGRKSERPIVFVGKGITFDSGGISIKPGAGMGDMKMDMGGSGAVIGAMRAIAELKLPHNVVALVPTTENMPSGSAYKPGDVITFMNGKTAEIDNTDAEGRLILADALTYADRYKPQAVIDLATLTGAIVIALGEVGTGMFGNNDELKSRVKAASERTYDRVVELPLWEEYEELIRSDIADVKNSGGRSAGSITAALFLQHFIGDYPWVHLDIAGTGMLSKPSGYNTKGGSGAGVRLLVDLVQNWTGTIGDRN